MDPVQLHRAGNVRLERTPEEISQIRELVGWPPKIDGFAFKTREQVDCAVGLREALKDLEGHCHFMSQDIDDARHLLCFLRARRFDVIKAEKMWRRAYEWRKKRDPRSVCAEYKGMSCSRSQNVAWWSDSRWQVDPLIDRYATGGPWGDDPDGSPCSISTMGRLYLNELLAARKDMYQLMMDFEIIKNEMSIAQMDYNTLRDGKIHTQATVIFDLTGVGLRLVHGPALTFFKEAIELSDAYYPDRMKIMLMCKAPKFVYALQKVVTVFMDEETKVCSSWRVR